jgi:uncharacterized protein YkwD
MGEPLHLTRLTSGLLATLLVVGVVPGSAAASSDSCFVHKRFERRLARKINGARARVGRRTLHLDPHLSRVARHHTRAMTRRGFLFHSSARELGRRVTNWTALGENVGAGSGIATLHRAFMDSAGHRRNVLLRSCRHVGVGVRRARGRIWVTVVFESRANPGTTLPMPSC